MDNLKFRKKIGNLGGQGWKVQKNFRNVEKFWKFGKILETLRIFRYLEIIQKFGQLKIWRKKI